MWQAIGGSNVDATWREVSRCFIVGSALLSAIAIAIPDPLLSKSLMACATGFATAAAAIERFIKQEEQRGKTDQEGSGEG
jgi:DNA-binding transcriptional regulator YdaS (Cro superfamily)